MDLFPRPNGRGLIEALVAIRILYSDSLFPRPNGRGLIEADGWQRGHPREQDISAT